MRMLNRTTGRKRSSGTAHRHCNRGKNVPTRPARASYRTTGLRAMPGDALPGSANSIMSEHQSLTGFQCHEFAFSRPPTAPNDCSGPPGGREICRRPVGAAQGRPDAAARPGPLHRRRQPAGPGLCGDGAQPDRPRRHPRDRHRGRAQNAGRARRLYRRRSEGLRPAQMRRAVQQPRRLADEEAAAPGAGDRQGALCRRPGRLRRRRDRARGQGRGRSGRGRYRAAARRHRGRGRSAQPGAPQLYDDVPGNVALDYHYGDAEAVKAAFAKAAHVTRLQLVNSRLVVDAMEPRAALAAYDGQPLHALCRLAGRVRHARQSRRGARRDAEGRCACSPARSAARSA